MMQTEALILSRLAQPMTHVVVTVYGDGTEIRHPTRSIAQAENFATGERRKIGRSFVRRATGMSATVISVLIEGVEG